MTARVSLDTRFQSPSPSQDLPPGQLTSDTTWTVHGSPYVLAGDLTVAVGLTLVVVATQFSFPAGGCSPKQVAPGVGLQMDGATVSGNDVGSGTLTLDRGITGLHEYS